MERLYPPLEAVEEELFVVEVAGIRHKVKVGRMARQLVEVDGRQEYTDLRLERIGLDLER